MDEKSKEVLTALAIPGNCVKDILKVNNTHFYQKGWDNGFACGVGLTGLAVGGLIFVGAAACASYAVMKGISNNGSKSVQTKQ